MPFKPGEFNFVRAWEEAAKPAFNALPANLRDLYGRVIRECASYVKDANCDLPWPDPETSDLRSVFDKVPSEYLAQAAKVIHAFGHWASDGTSQIGNGAHWRFANYADQSLRSRLNVGGSSSVRNGFGYWVGDGTLRYAYSDRDTWTWREVGYATQDTLARCRQIEADTFSRLPAKGRGAVQRTNLDTFEKRVAKMIEVCAPKDDTHAGMVFHAVRLYTEPDARTLVLRGLQAAFNGSPIKVVEIRDLWEPHTFVIGSKHVAYAADHCGGILGEEVTRKIPCDACRKPYADHKRTIAAFLDVQDGEDVPTREVLSADLFKAKAVAEESKIDGFAFVGRLGEAVRAFKG